MEHTIGIDLGTTNSCVAVLTDGQPEVIPNAEGSRTTPSVVALDGDGERLVGAAARRQAVIYPERTLTSIKRFMGRKLSEVSAEEAIVPYRLVAGHSEAVRIKVAETEYSPEEISAHILAKLKADAEAYLGAPVGGAVITVPAYFNDAQRQATKNAAEIAGLKVLRLVNEPTAAALAYGLQSAGDGKQKLLVFDLGGGTFDVSVLDVSDGVFEVLATKGDNHLGGDDFDKAIVDWLAAGFQKDKGLDLTEDPAALQRLYEAAEKAKIELSSAPKTQVSLPFIHAAASGPEHLEVEISRAQLNKLTAPLIERLVGPTNEVAAAAGLTFSEIDGVLLVGGMTRMPAIQEAVKEITGQEPQRNVNPDEAVALGAAVQAAIIEGQVEDVLLIDVTPLTLGIETKGGIATKIIPANTTVPVQVQEVFTTAEDNQPSVEVHIVQGEREMAADNRSLGRLQLMPIPPAPRGAPQIEVIFSIDVDGLLNVSARDLDTGMEQARQIKASTGLIPAEIERMRSDAEQFAELDRQKLESAQAHNEAEALRDQIERTLSSHAEIVTADERYDIDRAIAALNELLASEADAEALRQARDQLAAAVADLAQRITSDAPAA